MSLKTLFVVSILSIFVESCDSKHHKISPEEIQLKASSKMVRSIAHNSAEILKMEYDMKPLRVASLYNILSATNSIFSDFYKRADASEPEFNANETTLLKVKLSRILDTSRVWESAPEILKKQLSDLSAKSIFIAENKVAIFNQWLNEFLLSRISSSCNFRKDYLGKAEVIANSVTIPIFSRDQNYYHPGYKLLKLTRNGTPVNFTSDFSNRPILARCQLDSLLPGKYKAYISSGYMDFSTEELLKESATTEFAIQ